MKYTATWYYPEGYLSNTYTKLDAVNIMTVHQSKGLEAKDSSYLVKYDGKIAYNADNIPSLKKESMPVSLNFSLLED